MPDLLTRANAGHQWCQTRFITVMVSKTQDIQNKQPEPWNLCPSVPAWLPHVGQRALDQDVLLLNTRNVSGRLRCAASRPALHEHLRVEISHTKEKGISLPHSSRENDYGCTWTPQSENNTTKEKALSHTGQELRGFTQLAEDIRDVATAGTWDFHPKPMPPLRCRKPSEPPSTVVAAP